MRSLANIIEDMDISDLLTLDSRDITDPTIIDTVRPIEKLGEEQYDA